MLNVIGPMAAGTMLIGYGAYNAYQQRQERLNKQQELRSNLIELIDATGNTNLISNRDTLINQLETAGNDRQKKLAAWHAIIKPLNPEYWITRDNTLKFDKVTPHATALVAVVAAAVADLDGNLADNSDLAHEVVQFIFKASNYYSLASTLDDKNFDLCSNWLLKARDFIAANGLTGTIDHAIWFNLSGGHKSREYQMSRTTARPIEAVNDFKDALRIHMELKHDLDNVDHIQLRHIYMCLSSTILQDAMWCVMHDKKISEETQQNIDYAKSLLEAITDERLVLKSKEKNVEGHEILIIKKDLYRIAGRLQFQGYALILEGKFEEAVNSIHEASETMRHAIPTTGAKGQLSAILNDEANAWVALATSKPEEAQDFITKAKECLNESKSLSMNKFEQMYAENAEKMLQQIDANYTECFYSKLAATVLNPAKNSPSPRVSM